MRGTILKGFQEMIENQYGVQTWRDILASAGAPAFPLVLASSEIDDEFFDRVLETTRNITGLQPQELGDRFGDYWINTYSQRFYAAYYKKNPTLKSFLLDLDRIHAELARMGREGRPMRFRSRWLTPDIFQMFCESPPGFLPLAIGLLNGAARFYRETVQLLDVGPDSATVQILGKSTEFPVDK